MPYLRYIDDTGRIQTKTLDTEHFIIGRAATCQLTVEDYGTFSFPLDPFAAYRLTHDIDQLDFILQNEQEISAHEQRYNK